MADEAHDWTDKQIEALQRKFGHVYSETAKEMREKLDKHLKAYEEGNAEWQKRLAIGEAKQSDYEKWLHQMTTDRKFMSGMVNRLSTDATAANQKAIDLINDRIPRVYAENANHAAYQVESGLGWDTHSFDLYDESTVRKLLTATDQDQIIHEVIPVGSPRPKWQDLRVDLDRAKDVRWNRQKFTSAITQSILQGESIPDTAKRLMRVLNMDRGMATRAARTAMTSAENAGRVDSYKRAKRIGINLEQEWMATLDERTRYSHRELDGQHVPVGGKFVAKSTGHELEFPADPKAHPSETYNCFVGGTLACSDTAIERSYRHEYSGKLVTIKTASGIEFTCTPNHPILTMSGWVAANLLHEGDNLCIARIGDSRLSGVNPDVNHIQSSMEAIHNLLALYASERVAGSDVNFHGDIPATDVEIVGEKRTLRLDVETSRGEDITELALELSDSTGLRFCPTRESVGSVMTPSTGSLCSKSISPSLLGCQFAHPHIHGVRTTAPFDPSIAEHPSDNIAGMSDAFGDSFLGISTEIGVDYIVNVEITHTRGTHVYNLQTESGYYFVGSKNTDNVIIAHNCRCTLVAWLPSIEQEDPERWSRLPKGMTYEEWKGAKGYDVKPHKDSTETLRARLSDYVGGGYELSDILTDTDVKWMHENEETYDSPLYRIEDKRFTASKLDKAIENEDEDYELRLGDTYRSFTSGGNETLEELASQFTEAGYNLDDYVVFKTVGKTSGFDMAPYAQEYMDDQKEVLVDGAFEFIGESSMLLNGRKLRLIMIRQMI